MKPLADRLGRPTVAVRRGLLHEILVSALPEGVLRLGHELETFSQNHDGVRVRFTNGLEATGDVLVGADGLRSKVRQALLSDGPPTYSGYRGWLGLVPFNSPSLPPGRVIESWGRGERFGALHCGGGEVYWFAAANRAEPIANVRPARKQDVLEQVRGWHEPFPSLIEATEEARIVELSFWDRDPVRKWGAGRVTLLGDAAHPMTPNIGQGACQAIEDGLALASELAKTREPEQSLRSYEAQRSARTAKFVLRSRRLGHLVQRPGVLSTRLRDTLVRLTPPHVQLNQMAKLFERPLEGRGSREASGIESELTSSGTLSSSALTNSAAGEP
jgi:2-polyprenyl-6-methoxyphenol hydroxylase-like FAD-dependent oxidoreductase